MVNRSTHCILEVLICRKGSGCMWSVNGRQVEHESGLVIEIVDGNFNDPMDLSIKGDKGFSAPELALMIREGIDYAVKSTAANKPSVRKSGTVNKPKRPIIKLKRD